MPVTIDPVLIQQSSTIPLNNAFVVFSLRDAVLEDPDLFTRSKSVYKIVNGFPNSNTTPPVPTVIALPNDAPRIDARFYRLPGVNELPPATDPPYVFPPNPSAEDIEYYCVLTDTIGLSTFGILGNITQTWDDLAVLDFPTDNLDITLRRLTDMIKQDPELAAAVTSELQYRGDWNPSTIYFRQDLVTHTGVLYIRDKVESAAGEEPSASSLVWRVLINFVSTVAASINNSAYGPSWAGGQSVPRLGQLYTKIESLQTDNDARYLLKGGDTATGIIQGAYTIPLADNTDKFAQTRWVRQYAAPLDSPSFTGVPSTASTPPFPDNSLKLATTEFVKQHRPFLVGSLSINNGFSIPTGNFVQTAIPFSAQAGNFINPTYLGVNANRLVCLVPGSYLFTYTFFFTSTSGTMATSYQFRAILGGLTNELFLRYLPFLIQNVVETFIVPVHLSSGTITVQPTIFPANVSTAPFTAVVQANVPHCAVLYYPTF